MVHEELARLETEATSWESPWSLALVCLDRSDAADTQRGVADADADSVVHVALDAIRSVVEPEGLVASLGDDRIVVTLPGFDATASAAIIEALRRHLESLDWRVAAGSELVTASCGVATMVEDGDVAALIDTCLARLERAMKAGGNCIVTRDDAAQARKYFA